MKYILSALILFLATLIPTAAQTVGCGMTSCETAVLTADESLIFEAVVRRHYDNRVEWQNQTIAYLSIREKDAPQSFLGRFSDYYGVFDTYSNMPATDSLDVEWFLMTGPVIQDGSNAEVFASDGNSLPSNEYRFVLTKIGGVWTVSEAYVIEEGVTQ